MHRIQHLLSAILIVATAPVFAQLSVTGSAEIKVAPDVVEIDLGIDVRRAKLEDAQKATSERLADTLKALAACGVPDKDVQSDFINIHPIYKNETSSDKTVPEYFELQRCIRVILHDVKSFDTVLNAALAAGVTDIHNIEFKSTELRKHRDQARINAVKAAREKAELMAKELDVKVGKVVSITENPYQGSGYYSYYGYYGSMWRNGRYNSNSYQQNSSQSVGGDGATSGTLAPGQIGISASVQVVFQIE